MLKTFLVEDEVVIREMIKKMIPWEQYGFELAGEASEMCIRDRSASVRMAIAFVAMLPILCLYPFLQRYFTKGIALGAVKG